DIDDEKFKARVQQNMSAYYLSNAGSQGGCERSYVPANLINVESALRFNAQKPNLQGYKDPNLQPGFGGGGGVGVNSACVGKLIPMETMIRKGSRVIQNNPREFAVTPQQVFLAPVPVSTRLLLKDSMKKQSK
ncbi:hypothetical protein HK102_006272, partial [Quaeritorhiza haematococci]